MLGWLFTGYHSLASKRRDDVNAFWQASGVKAFGFGVAITATIATFFVARVWWGVAVFLTAPNLAAVAIMLFAPRSS